MRLSAGLATAILALTSAGCGWVAPESAPPAGAPSTATAPTSSAVDTDAPSGASTAAVCGQPRPELARQLPTDLPTVAGWQPTEVVEQGQTREIRGVLVGEAADLESVRDAAAREIVAAGYRQTGSDEEPGFEAEAEFEGVSEVNITIKPWCRGHLVLSYTVRQ